MGAMQVRKAGTIVYIGGDMTPMIVVEPDQWRPSRKPSRDIKLRPEDDPDGEARWYRSDMVTGGD